MEDIWPLVVVFGCLIVFALLMLGLNINIKHNGLGKRLSYYLLWLSIIGAIAQLIYIVTQVNEVN